MVTDMQRLIGVEEELLIVDQHSGRTMPLGDRLVANAEASRTGPARSRASLQNLSPPAGIVLEHEAKLEQVESILPPLLALDEVGNAILAGRELADLAARTLGARVAALATSVVPGSTHLTENPRYETIGELFGLTMKEQLTCGMHIHVTVRDKDEGVAVLDRIRPWLHVLLALSANSPMWAGIDTGYSSYRYQAWMRWPSAGSYDRFGSAQEYRQLVRALVATGVILDPGMVYFDARLSTHNPTVEIRAPDVCLDPEHAVGIAGLARALVNSAAAEAHAGRAPDPFPTSLMRLAMWSASRYGLNQTLWDPNSRGPRQARVVVDALLRYVGVALRDSGDEGRVRAAMTSILESGTGSEVQCQTLARTGSLAEVVAEAIRRTHPGA